jgi:hypothetical protein
VVHRPPDGRVCRSRPRPPRHHRRVLRPQVQREPRLGQLENARQVFSDPNLYQGAGGERVGDLKKLGAALGLGDLKGTSNIDVARAVANQLTLQARSLNGGMPGSLSDSDRNFLARMSTSLDNNPDANQRILDIYDRAHRRAVEADDLRQQYVQDHGQLDEGFRSLLAQRWTPENKRIDAANAEREKAASKPPAATGKRPPLDSIFK